MMLTAETLRQLAALNLDQSQMAGFLSILAEVLEKEENRKREQAERKRRSRDGHKNVTVTSPNGFPDPSLTPKENPPKGGQKKGVEEFEQFWLAYPADRRKEKPKAAEAWRGAVKLSPPADILASLARYCRTREVREGFAPYPAKWLKNQRWMEDHEAEAPKDAYVAQAPQSAPSGPVTREEYERAKKIIGVVLDKKPLQSIIDRYEKQKIIVAQETSPERPSA